MNPLPVIQLSLPSWWKPCLHAVKCNTVSQHPMRPNVAAPNCSIHWLTPFGINFMNHLSNSFLLDIIACDWIVLTQCIKIQMWHSEELLCQSPLLHMLLWQLHCPWGCPHASQQIPPFPLHHYAWCQLCRERHITFLAIRPQIMACNQWHTMEWRDAPRPQLKEQPPLHPPHLSTLLGFLSPFITSTHWNTTWTSLTHLMPLFGPSRASPSGPNAD